MASIPVCIFAINLNTLTTLLTNFNNTKTLLETAKILSQLHLEDEKSIKLIEKFKVDNRKLYQQEITIFSRSEKHLNDAYNLIQAYYYLYGKDYWYKVMLKRITNKLLLSKINEPLLKSIFINENFDLLMKNLDYVSKELYKYNEIISSLLSMYRWKIEDIYKNMQEFLKEKKYDEFIINYEKLKNLDEHENIKKAIGVDFKLPNIDNINLEDSTLKSVEIFKYFPQLFEKVYKKSLAKAKDSFQKGRYSDTINILTNLIAVTKEASNLLTSSQISELQNMLTKSKAVRDFVLGISNLYLEIQRANSWTDFKNIMDDIYSDFDTSYIIYFDHAFINGKLTIIFRDYKNALTYYIKIKKDSGEDILKNMTSLYNESQLLISKIKYNDMLKDNFEDLSRYLKEYIKSDNEKRAGQKRIFVSSITVSTIIIVIVLLWIFLPPIQKANFFLLLRMNKTALSIMQKHLIKEAENPHFHLTLGEIYERMGRENEAEYHYKIAMQYFKERGDNANKRNNRNS